MTYSTLDMYDFTARMTPITKSIIEKLQSIVTDLSNQYGYVDSALTCTSNKDTEFEIIVHRYRYIRMFGELAPSFYYFIV